MQFVHQHPVRFAEVDAVGIVFFSRAFEFAHIAFEALLIDVGLPLADIIANEPWVMPLVHVEADYKAPMRLGEELRIAVVVERLGTSSVTFRFDISCVSQRVVVRHVHACMDKSTGRPIPLPDRVRTALATYVQPD